MVDLQTLRLLRPGEWGQLPLTPGVYCFCDGQGQVLYVGKSVRLRERVRSYFRKRSGLPRSKRAMVRAT
jgi:excinuclease ABC subunit C